ncbi:hypothetical protein Tco_1325770 [Tanacetum coccineum]
MKKKDQISLDEELAFKLQAKEEKEERLSREKSQREEEANIVAWDNVQAMIDVDYQMGQQMQAEEQEKLIIEEKSNLFVQLLEARKKHFVTWLDTRTISSEVRAEAEIAQEGSSKRAGTELEQEKEVAIDAIPLATKPLSIVEYKIYKEGKKTYYQIIKANGSSKMYLVFSHTLKSFDREDLETL